STYLIRTAMATPIVSSHYLGFKSELVFDNSEAYGVNMTEGNKLKIRYENHLGLSDISESFYRVSLDFRRYQKLHRDLIIAVRIAGSHSGGKATKISMMGGMDNWVRSRVPVNFNENVEHSDIFLTVFPTYLRGFK